MRTAIRCWLSRIEKIVWHSTLLAQSDNSLGKFLATFGSGKILNEKLALTAEWKSVDFLFQRTDDEIHAAGPQQILFNSKGTYNGAVIESYLFR